MYHCVVIIIIMITMIEIQQIISGIIVYSNTTVHIRFGDGVHKKLTIIYSRTLTSCGSRLFVIYVDSMYICTGTEDRNLIGYSFRDRYSSYGYDKILKSELNGNNVDHVFVSV